MTAGIGEHGRHRADGASGPIDGFWAVIPAGGAGTRLWPVSRRTSPKFLHDLTGTGRTMLQGTWDRLAPLAEGRVVVVTGEAHAEAVRTQLPDASDVIAEPSPRDSMPAIGLAAAIIERRDPDAVIGSFAADHVIDQVDLFDAAVHAAAAVARTGKIVTIGITPTAPSTAFGYIRQGDLLGIDGAETACAVEEFVEKPDAATATEYLSGGGFWWNAGMFVVKASVLLDALALEHPAMAASLRAIAADLSTLGAVWPTLDKIAIDHAVAEPAAAAGLVAVVPAAFRWDDVGDFDSLGTLLPDVEGRPGVKVIGDAGSVVTVDGTGIVVPGSGRVVALVGLDDVVVIDTPDAVLVIARDRAQDVKKVVEALTADGRTHLT
ncbi:mannose-1-phosphate guanylyltransferase [Lapillicoccus sp.]|uniref:mannose-1-phosphate guanylyltransferase n=1 Tax=Lapillicoccus sp. TaxID=1909287 RepID=UPI002600FF2C|nr:mannose-1-phosphate guanylyltransferase [Lapillicoccus sp.]